MKVHTYWVLWNIFKALHASFKKILPATLLDTCYCYSHFSPWGKWDTERSNNPPKLHIWLVENNWSSKFNHWIIFSSVQFSSVAQSCPTLRPHGLQHARLPCPSPTSRTYSHSCPLSWWCHPTISSSVVPFSSCPQSFPSSGSFQMSRQFFASGGQSIGVSPSASVLPMNIQDRFPLGWTGWISLQSKGLSRDFSNTTVQKHQFFGAQLSL